MNEVIPSTSSDEELVSQAKAQNYRAFEELMKRYEKGIYNLALRITKSPQEAEEILQDTFLSVFKNIDGFREESSFKTWIYKVATNFALMKLRKKKQISRVFIDEPLQLDGEEIPRDIADWSKNPEDLYEKQELRRILKDAVDSLPDTYQTVFWLRDIDGLSNQEVATILGLSLPAVKSRILRARLLMREYLSEYFKDGKSGRA
ncbi:MAG: sigma-70 family RNA polymerase sigma factor [Candidatus Eremiobacteraeota bacterium]|nr:sigma-70 family RNA polymerase sigma factor [Candidatus Eremiobacteraeota bacterium]